MEIEAKHPTKTTRSISSITPLIANAGPFNEVVEEFSSDESFQTLKSAKVLVIGAGGLGCEILKDLALTGFRNIDVIDMDTIDLSNLNRQFLFRQGDIGQPKAEVAARAVLERIGDALLNIRAYYCKIQDMSLDYYKKFDAIICGLDSVEARRWINATLVSMVDANFNNLIPLIDGGTEGLRGQSRVILPRITSCYECTLDMITPRTTYPVCTIANTPRLPEHCIEWASVLEWPRHFPNRQFDADNPEDVEWMYEKAKRRAQDFKIVGVSKQMTLGVVKNIIPAIASTNAIIAASCCNEAFKYVTSTNPILDNYMMYSGDSSVFTYTYPHAKRLNCAVCGNMARNLDVKRWMTLADFIEDLSERPEVGMKQLSLATSTKNLYLRSPEALEKFTWPNLGKKLSDLITNGEEIVATDPDLPISLRLIIRFC